MIKARLCNRLLFFMVAAVIFVTACTSTESKPAPTQPESQANLPQILAVKVNNTAIARYEKLDLAVSLEAVYDNPFDVRQVDLTALFTGPDGNTWSMPGFWNDQESWGVRFAPAIEGEWRYRLQVRDQNGESESWEGQFTATPSEQHGWLQVGSWVDPAYSPRYLVHHDGTPFYGVGQGNAFDLNAYGFDAKKGLALFDKMVEHKANMVVYWPIFSNPFFSQTHDRYSLPDLKVLDLIVEDAARKGIYIVFTVWNHDLLRDDSHPWSEANMGDWANQNGFRELGSLDSFFTDEEAWAWQENLYRYLIARWGYSPAIGLWLTVSEIDGTNAYAQTDVWHQRVNDYFVANDPYRHPTSASMAGDRWWPEGYRVMDVPQIHSYDTSHDAVGTGPRLAEWTQKMGQAEEKPNFIGEFGTANQRNHPELLHNGIWAALATGAAITPLEWNDSGPFGQMTDDMFTHLTHLSLFVSDLPLAHLNPVPLPLAISDENLTGWGLGGDDWGFFWMQDISMVGAVIDEVRENVLVHSEATVTIEGLTPGPYLVKPFDTWQGQYLTEYEATAENGRLVVTLPDFERDLAVKLVLQ